MPAGEFDLEFSIVAAQLLLVGEFLCVNDGADNIFQTAGHFVFGRGDSVFVGQVGFVGYSPESSFFYCWPFPLAVL